MNLHLGILLLAIFQLAHGVTVNVDTSRANDLAAFGRRVKATLEDYYPRAVSLLRSPTFRDVSQIQVFFDPNERGVAYASGTRIVGGADYYRKNQNDIGSMVHEMAHVIQAYPRGCPGWVVEGIADWVRYFHFEPNKMPGKPRQGSRYTDGYGTSAYFLNWVNQRYQGMNYWINKDCREGTYNDNIFNRLIGKSVGQLWDEMMRS